MAALSPLDSLRFPPSAFEDLGVLARNTSSIEPIAKSVEQFVSTFPFRKVVAGVSRAVGLDEEAVRGILNSLLNIVTLVELHEIDSPTLVPLFSSRMQKVASDAWKRDHLTAWTSAEKAIVTATRIDGPFFFFHKARTLANLHENVVHSLRIVTDLRPVFDNDARSMKAGVISHKLVVEYVTTDEDVHERICLTLDALDIEELFKQSQRAKGKVALLQSEFKSSSWALINFGEGE